jgi:hypothetical protein
MTPSSLEERSKDARRISQRDKNNNHHLNLGSHINRHSDNVNDQNKHHEINNLFDIEKFRNEVSGYLGNVLTCDVWFA